MEGVENAVLFSFKCLCSQQIMENGGQDMLDAMYSDLKCDESEKNPDYDVTLKIGTGDMPQTQKVSKKMSEEEQKTVRAANEEVRDQRQKMCDAITERVSKFKRDFMGAPIRKALIDIGAGKAITNCVIPYRDDEKYWLLAGDPGHMTIVYAINFPSVDDVALARVMLVEYQAAMRKTRASCQVKYHDKEPPTEMTGSFPDVKIEPYSNGFMTLSKYSTSLAHPRLPLCRIRRKHPC